MVKSQTKSHQTVLHDSVWAKCDAVWVEKISNRIFAIWIRLHPKPH